MVFKILRTVLVCAAMLSVISVPVEVLSAPSAGAPELIKEPVVFEYRDPDTGNLCMKASYDHIRVKNDAYYGALADTIESGHNVLYNSLLQAMLEENKGNAREVNRSSEGMMYFSVEETAQVLRSDEKLVSLYGEMYTFLGGAHPAINHYGWNFAPETGGRVWLNGVVSDPGRFIEASLQAFKRLEKGKDVKYDSDSPDRLKEMLQKELSEDSPHEIQWTMDETGGLTLYFDAGTFGGYAFGPVELFLPGDSGLVKAEYRR